MSKPIYKIAVVIPKYGLIGGAEGFVAELTERIADDGRYEMHVFANRWIRRSEKIIFHHVPILPFPKFLTTPSFAWFARKKITALNCALIHAHERIFAADIFTMHGVPHRFWCKEIRGKKRLSLYDIATARVEENLVRKGNCVRFLAVSGLAREIFLREYPVDPAQVEIIHPGVAAMACTPEEREQSREKAREAFGIPRQAFLALFVSMNFEIKGLDQIMAAMGELRRRLPERDCRLLVAGRGNEKKYRQLAERHGLRDRVVFTGPLPGERMEELYSAGDLLIMLSQFDAFGLVVLEAMAASLPVIVSKNVGAKDVVNDGVNGFVIENISDTGAIADKIGLLFKGNTRHQMGKEALRTARASNWEAVADRVLMVYEDILQSQVISKMPHP